MRHFSVLLLLTACWSLAAYGSQDFTSTSSATGIIQSLSKTKSEITRKIEAQKSLENAGLGVALPAMTEKDRGYLLEGGHITSNGTLVGFNSKYRVLVVLEPTYRSGAVEWRCKVIPATASPKSCQ